MRRFFLRRRAESLLMLAFIVLAVFVIMRLTAGDPARIKAPIFASEDVLDRYRAEFGTDTPLPTQLVSFLAGIVRGDFGESFRYQEPVFSLIAQRLPPTAMLALSALLLAVGGALLLGVAGARRPDGWLDRLGQAIAAFGQSAPRLRLRVTLVVALPLARGGRP